MGLPRWVRSEEHTSALQSPCNLVCRLLLEKKNAEGRCGPHPLGDDTVTTAAFARPFDCTPPAELTPAERVAAVAALLSSCFFFFNDPATTEIYTLSLHDALPI